MDDDRFRAHYFQIVIIIKELFYDINLTRVASILTNNEMISLKNAKFLQYYDLSESYMGDYECIYG